MLSLTLIMGISFIGTTTVIFSFRIDKLKKSGVEILEISQNGFSDTLTKQLDYVKEGLDHIAFDMSIREYILNNQPSLLSDLLTARYAYEAKRRMVIYDDRTGRFIPELPAEIASLKPLMETLSTQAEQTRAFQRTGDNTFITVFSKPMIDNEQQIATAYLLYDITNDQHFWNLIQSTRLTLNRILIKTQEARLYNLQTGEEVLIPDYKTAKHLLNAPSPVTNLFPNETLMAITGFPQLLYAGNITPLNEQVKSVKIILLYLCVLIVIITLCLSFFIAKVVSKPLEKMADEALQISKEPSNITLDEEKVEYLEFKQLAHAFNQVLLNLFSAQEKLKNEASQEKKRLQEELHRAMKMEAVGAMAGGVAHDLNNILSGLVSYPELLLMDLPEDSPLRKPILTIQKSGEKAAAIVQDMLTLARRNVNITEIVNLNSIIQEYLKSPEHNKMMSYSSDLNSIIQEYLKSPEHNKMMSYSSDVTLRIHLEPNLLNMVGSGIHLSKALMNLISNAIEAMPRGGEIHVSTQNKNVDIPVTGYDTVNNGDYVLLTVSDNGVGISPSDQKKIFEPFYTKKKMGRSGTGLGMAVVWGAVKDHNGYIDLQSEPGVGTTFTLYFPATRKALLENEGDQLMNQYMGKGETVLVVDDMVDQQEIATDMLTRLGYRVSSVSSGEEAVEYMKTNSADILVLDMIMAPGIDGLETYKRIIAIHPDQKAVVASGFSETERVKEVQKLGAGPYLKKPYLLKNIGPAIRRELDR
jgi:signal transduction histidine kinase/ActR/RegA family two-component response regulator